MTLPDTPTLARPETASSTTVDYCGHTGEKNAVVWLTRNINSPHWVTVHCQSCDEIWTTTVARIA